MVENRFCKPHNTIGKNIFEDALRPRAGIKITFISLSYILFCGIFTSDIFEIETQKTIFSAWYFYVRYFLKLKFKRRYLVLGAFMSDIFEIETQKTIFNAWYFDVRYF